MEAFQQLSIFDLQFDSHSISSQAVLSAHEVRQIKNKLKSGVFNDPVSISSLARRYNVSRTTIRNIRDGKTWSWIE